MAGKVTLVGAGPGDPGLLTVKGRRALESAEVVAYDRLVGPEVLALIPETARAIDVGKEASRHLIPQEQINDILLREGLAGHNVVRLKGGDPFVFGRGGEELEALARGGVDFEVVPGVTSAIAAAGAQLLLPHHHGPGQAGPGPGDRLQGPCTGRGDAGVPDERVRRAEDRGGAAGGGHGPGHPCRHGGKRHPAQPAAL